MSRIFVSLLFAVLMASPADAAGVREKGVTVWRGAAPATVQPPSLKGEAGGPCAHQTIILVESSWPARRLRTHGFWSGDRPNWETRLPLTTQGFYADRIAAGL